MLGLRLPPTRPPALEMRRLRRAALALAVVVGGWGALALPIERPGWAGVGAAVYGPDREECAFLGEINAYRRANGLSALALSSTLGAAAEFHSQDMAQRNYFGHTIPGKGKDKKDGKPKNGKRKKEKRGKGVSWEANIRRYGYGGNPIGENIAAGPAGARDVFGMWKDSPAHRQNMLQGSFGAIGIGRAYDRNSKYGWYWTTAFGGQVDDRVSC